MGPDPNDAVDFLTRANDLVMLIDAATGAPVWANDASRQFGWEPEEVVARRNFELIHPDDVERVLIARAAINEGHQPPSSAPYRLLRADGVYVECDISPVILGDRAAPHAIGIHVRPTRDSLVLRQLLVRLLAGDSASDVLGEMLSLLHHRNEHLRVLLSFGDEDGAGRVVGHDLDPRLAGAPVAPGSPWHRAEVGGAPVVVEDLGEFPPEVRTVAEAAGFGAAWIVPVRTADGVPIAMISLWALADGPPVQLDPYSVGLLEQLTELVLQWRRQARDLERAATRDPLTGLPNRRALAEFDADGPRRDLGVLFIDLDHFKPVNDRLGHAAGDQVLRTVAARLQSTVRPTDMVARLGGDEFGIICPGCSRTELADLGARVQAVLAEAVGVHGQVVHIGCSIGAALGHDSVGPLLGRADAALYDAKDSGRGAFRWADADADG